MRKTWGNSVFMVGKNSGFLQSLYYVVGFYIVVGVYKTGGLCTGFGRSLQGFIHYQIINFISVVVGVFRTIPKTYNKLQLSNNLFIVNWSSV